MFRLVFLLGFMTFLSAASFRSDTLNELLSNPVPSWMLKQISEDLAPFKSSGLKIEDLLYTCKRVPGLAHIKIKDNVVTCIKRSGTNKIRLNPALDVLQKATEYFDFPDVEFLVSTEDHYDSPLFHIHTKCPVFTICKRQGNKLAILWPEFRGLAKKIYYINDCKKYSAQCPWNEKQPIAFWRGHGYGYYKNAHAWDFNERSKVILCSLRHPNLIDAKFPAGPWADKAIHDIPELADGGFRRPQKQVSYKYLLAIDGNTFPSSLIWQLGTDCLVLKNKSEYNEWFYKGIQDGVHYVSFDSDCRDLPNLIEYFNDHDEEAQAIANAGNEFANKYLLWEGPVFYLYELLKAYADLFPKDIPK